MSHHMRQVAAAGCHARLTIFAEVCQRASAVAADLALAAVAAMSLYGGNARWAISPYNYEP